MAEVLISPESTLDFSYSSALGAFANSNLSPTFSLTAGQQYRILWDGSSYTRTGFAFTTADGSECVGVGNPLAAGQESNGDLFCIVYDKTHDYMHHLSLEQTATHTVSVYEITGSEVGIIQYDRNGNPMEFYGKKVLRVDTTDGGTRDFVHANLVEKTVELDFSRGSMEIDAGEDELFSKILIPKPETLSQENILEGVRVAGIEGALKASGGGSANDLLVGAVQEIKCDAQTVIGTMLADLPNLEVVELPNATTIAKTSYYSFPPLFYGCKKLKRFYAPLADTATITAAYQNHTALEEFIIPNWTGNVVAAMFAGCSNLRIVKIGKSTTNYTEVNSLFNNCRNLETAEIGNLKKLGSSAFAGCSKLVSLIIRSDALVALTSSSYIGSSGIGTGIGYVYVPASLVATYKAASYWSAYASRIRAIEDYPEICG